MHTEVLYNIIANITNVARLCIDNGDEIFIVGDKTWADLCAVCLRLFVVLNSSELWAAHLAVADVKHLLLDDIFVANEVFLLHRQLVATMLFVLNLEVCWSVRWLSTNILGCSIIVLIIGVPN